MASFIRGLVALKLPSHGRSSSVDPYFWMPFIVKGYRHVTCTTESLLSCFTMSNEVANIWSHVLGAAFFVVSIVQLVLEAWSDKNWPPVQDRYWPLIAQQIGCFVCMAGSASAHIFHSQSDWNHQVLFIVDYFSISFYTAASSIAHYAYSRPVDPDAGIIAHFSMDGYLWFALVGHLAVFTIQCFNRFIMFASPLRPVLLSCAYALAYSINFLPFLSRRFAAAGGEQLPSDPDHWAQFYWCVLSAVVMAAHAPQRWAPEMFYFLHGHFWMHAGMFLSVLYQRAALRWDMETRWSELSRYQQPGYHDIMLMMSSYCVLGVILSCLIARYGINVQKLKAASRVSYRQSR